ncbi:MAG: Ig-like domain-containing protein [Eubacterium coprostanoligenes]|uniref:Ig-like domain-containing protein n=1 Tax=Eubacterium coprostanoligenes TaxID=290054 RepID=UPI0024092D61|nr:Ig-like domain-containing protein [Eubacterium coprostanoligenes]MDD6664780.1 Ig-like domain-containing protein [Eubacterium coprostanoligenes]
MTKTKKGIIIAIVAVIVAAAVGCGLYFGLGSGKADPADVQVQDGEIYRTKTESFWAGVGKAYISFQHKEEPENKAADDTELYGDVFYIMVSSGEGFDPWIQGNYNLDEANGKLMMTATWDVTAENQTKLADAISGEEKIYVAENGEYKIPVELPSAKVTFTLNPATDKVGSLTPAPEDTSTTEPTTEDKADENTGNLFARLTAEDSLFNGDVKGYAQIDMAKDGTWTMKVKVEPYVPSYTPAVNGKWVENKDGSLTLTVSGGDYKDGIAQSFDFKKNSDGTYSGAVKFTADKANGIVFNFNFKSTDVNKDTTAGSDTKTTTKKNSTPAAVAKGELYRTPVFHGIYSGIVGDAYISFMGNGDFKVYVDAGDGYSPWITGKWSLNSDNTKLTLTQKGSGDAGLTGAKADTPKTYTAKNGEFSIDAYFPSGGKATFSLKPSRDKVSSDSSSSSKPQSPSNPTKPTTPSTPEKPAEAGDIVLNATDSIYDGAITCKAVLTVKKNGTWNMSSDVYGNYIESAASGTWVENSDKSLTLTATKVNELAQLESPFKLNYNSSTGKYIGTVKLTCSGQYTFNLKFESNKINEGEQTVSVSGVTLDKQSVELTVNKTYTLTATVSPNNATNKAVNWSSTDESIATVTGGKITAKSAGTAYIIVSTKDGGFTASCRVTVTEPTADDEYYTATSNDKCNGFPMSLIFENGTFHLNVDTTYFDATDWFKGTYSFNADKSELNLNVGYNAGGPHLEAAEATSADAVTYTAESGKFTIVVKDPSASAVNGTFTLTVGSTDPEPTPEPEPEPTPEPNLQLELVASDTLDLGGTAYTANAKLDMYDDNTFKMLVDAGEGYTEAASGTWALDAAYNMVLTVENQTIENSLPDTITLNVDYTTYQYSGTVNFVASVYTTFTFNFAPATEPEPEPEPEPTVQLTLTATDTLDLGGMQITANAKLDMYDDNTFKMLVDAGEGYTEAASGTWALDAAYNMVLTVENQTIENSLPDTVTLNVDYITYQYSGTVNYVASAYTTFTFDFS